MSYLTDRRRPLIVDPSKEEVEVTDHTSKIFPLVLTPGNERFAYVEEDPSWFHRRREDGQFEKVPKRKGEGYAGGGGGGTKHAGETPLDTAIREGNEELGTPIECLKKKIRPDICITVFYGWEQHPFHLFYVGLDEEDIQCAWRDEIGRPLPFVNRAAISDPKLSGKKAGWASLRQLWKAILAPKDREEQRALEEERGKAWFYHGHTVLLVAMLLRLKELGILKDEQEKLPQIVFRQIAPRQCFSRRMMERITEESALGEKLLLGRIPTIKRNERLSLQAASFAVSKGFDELAGRIVEQAEGRWKDTLAKHVSTARRRRRAEGQTFGSMEEMFAFLENEPWEETSEDEFAEADSEFSEEAE